ncbi:MAG TPA: hypothetical protein VNO52_01220 [Methylomirabilota bacterium]|nr:hypothetical protein [Methylomirabilota bacterium]
MDCRTTSSKCRPRAGFALIEALFAIGITGLVLAALASVSTLSGRSFAALGNYVELDDKNRIAIDTLTRDIRGANRVTACTTNSLTLEDSDGAALTYSYSPTTMTLSRSKSGVSTVLLRDCERFSFEMCLRTPQSGTYDLPVTTDPSLCKVINVSWLCSRTILGLRQNTESVQTARIVIRKQGS